jgi:hypothetical protein
MVRLLQFLATRRPSPWWDWGRREFPCRPLLGPGLYFGIAAFNLTMTFLIGETCLGWVGVFILLPFLSSLILKVSSKQ